MRACALCQSACAYGADWSDSDGGHPVAARLGAGAAPSSCDASPWRPKCLGRRLDVAFGHGLRDESRESCASGSGNACLS